MGTLIVTGGAGFIGANFARLALAETSSRVVVADALTYAGNLESLSELEGHPRYLFVKADIADREAVRALYREHRPSAVINFAAETHVDRSIDDPSAFVRTNVLGSFELLDGARHYLATLEPRARQGFRLLHVSTDEVYGTLGATGAFSEQTPYAPNSPYAASKAGADHLVRAYHETYGLPVLLTNCSNNYGPYQFPEKLIPLMLLNALEGKPLPIYGDGLNVRDWLYVEDHARALALVLERGGAGETYHIGGRNERTNIEVVRAVCALLDEMRPAPGGARERQIGFVADRPGHDRRYAIDPSKIERELGWRPAETFESALAKTVRWYLDHEDWWRNILARGYKPVRIGELKGRSPR